MELCCFILVYKTVWKTYACMYVLLMVIAGKGDVTISVDDENLLKLMTGKLNPQQVYFQLPLIL